MTGVRALAVLLGAERTAGILAVVFRACDNGTRMRKRTVVDDALGLSCYYVHERLGICMCNVLVHKACDSARHRRVSMLPSFSNSRRTPFARTSSAHATHSA